jgi:DNA-directed RNA polymerase subunit H (RpoH/RPB5)
VAHYYLGDAPANWRTGVPTYGHVTYRDVYPGIDAVYYGNQRRLEYDFVVAPGADWRTIRLAFSGVQRVSVDAESGELLLEVEDHVVRQPRPFTYQGTREAPEVVASRYVVAADGTVGFHVAPHDATRPLVIDPVIVYSTFLGGTGDDTAYDVAVDAAGAAYIVGETGSGNFPTGTPHTGTFNGGSNVFVAKLNPAGNGLEYTAFLGGTGGDQGIAIALDPAGNAYIAGRASTGFPVTTGAFQTSHGGGGSDPFVAKLSPTGTLLYATYLGGTDGANEQASDIAVGPNGSAYVVGTTRSRNFPVANALFPTHNGFFSDTGLAFVAQLNPAGTELVYSTYLGNQSQSAGRGIAVDATGAAYVAGFAGGIPTGTAVIMDFPVKNPFRPSFFGGPFVAKLAPGGGSLVYSTVVGDANGSFGGQAEDIAIDAAGNAYITGSISYSTLGGTPQGALPMVNAFESSPRGGLDGFVMKINAAGSGIIYSSYLGGRATTFDNGSELGRAIAVDGAGRAYVVGYTSSADFPLVNPLPLGGNGGPWDAYLTRFDAAGCAIGYSTLIGGGNTDEAFGVAVDASGNAYVVGDTASSDFPLLGAFQSTHRGGVARPFGGRESDAFAAKIAPGTGTPLSRCDTRGKRVTDPVQPTQTQRPPGQPPIFRFFDASALWFDPPIATGYKYTMVGTTLFTAVLDFPTGIDADDTFTVSVGNVVLGQFGPGQPVRFSQFASQLGALLVRGVGVSSFNVSGIAPARETEDPLAFPLQIEFDLPTGTFTMQATTDAAPPTPASISLAQATRRVLRGAGTTVLTVTRGGDTTAAVSATFATSAGTATAGSDFTTTTGTVNFAAGQTSATIAVPVGAGSGNATTETFTVALSSPSSGAALGATTSTVVTLLDGSAVFTQYFAEGATGAFFDTRLALLNPGGTAAEVVLTFQRADATVITSALTLAAGARATVRPATIAGLAQAEFSTRVDADAQIVADRTMRWDSTGYGSHAETSVATPATTWYFAEGATMGEFDLFYLLQNPGATASSVEVTYLLPAPAAAVVKTYTVAPGSRFTIWVDQEDPVLAQAEVGSIVRVVSGSPIIAERSMYRTVAGRSFSAGHNSAGVTAPATSWFLAEGATGAYFDLFVLLANPGTTDATVNVRYLLPDGNIVLRSYTVAARSRSNIWVDLEDPLLADTAVSTIVESTNAVPIIVERAMWWPGSSATWHEAHSSPGATTTGARWASAEGEVGGSANVATYVLLSNTSAFAGSAQVTVRFEDGTSAVRTFPLAATSRFNVDMRAEFPESVGKRFGVTVESLGATPAQLVVERAMYSDAGGVTWAAGSNALATRLP